MFLFHIFFISIFHLFFFLIFHVFFFSQYLFPFLFLFIIARSQCKKRAPSPTCFSSISFCHLVTLFFVPPFCVFSVFPSLASLPPRLPRRWFAAPRGILEASRSYITLSGPPLSVNHRLFTSFGPHTSTSSLVPLFPSSPLPPSLSPITPSLNPPHVLPYLPLLLFLVTSTYSFYPSLLPFLLPSSSHFTILPSYKS